MGIQEETERGDEDSMKQARPSMLPKLPELNNGWEILKEPALEETVFLDPLTHPYLVACYLNSVNESIWITRDLHIWKKRISIKYGFKSGQKAEPAANDRTCKIWWKLITHTHLMKNCISLRNSGLLQQEEPSTRFQREKRQEGRGKERSSTKVLRIIMAPKRKLEWRNTFKLSKQNNVQNPVCCGPNYVINQMQK